VSNVESVVTKYPLAVSNCVWELTVHVVPAAALAHETAEFMGPVGAATELAARDELDGSLAIARRAVRPHLQAQPLEAGLGRI
jgi:hypothetical protein